MSLMRMFLVFLVGSFLWTACHSAQNCYLSTTGLDTANCTSDSPCLTIGHCLSQFQGDLTISLNNGTYAGESNCHSIIGPQSGFTNLVIQGLPNTNVTIDCQNTNYHFHFMNIYANFTISTLNLLHGRSDPGGNGGCVLASNVTSLTIQNVVFTGCFADENGGALSTDSPTTVSDSTFTSNYAGGNGGAVTVITSNNTINMSRCVIQNNVAVSYGGGIYVYGPYLMFTNGNITWNNATTGGGGVYLAVADGFETFVGAYDVLGSTVSNNTANLGGGLYSQNLNHTWNFYGALLSNNFINTAISNTSDPNIYCGIVNSSFCYSCKAQDCLTGCAAGTNQTCSQNPSSKEAFCYSAKFTLCNTADACTCPAPSTGLTKAAKILIVFIAVCMVIGIFLIAIDTVRHFRRKATGYTPIS